MNSLLDFIMEMTKEGVYVTFYQADAGGYPCFVIKMMWYSGIQYGWMDTIPMDEFDAVAIDQRCAYWRQQYHYQRSAKGCTRDTI